MPRAKGEIIFSVSIAIFACFLLYVSGLYPRDSLDAGGGPTFYAKIVLIILLIASVVSLFNLLKWRKEARHSEEDILVSSSRLRMGLFILTMAGYFFGIGILGFLVGTIIYSVSAYFIIRGDLSHIMSRRGILIVFVISLFSISIYLVFSKLLMVFLPRGVGIFKDLTLLL